MKVYSTIASHIASIQNNKFNFTKLETFDKKIDITAKVAPKEGKLCQREGSEGTKDCYKREADEFCDGFIGFAALVTNPGVHLLILALCSC